MPSSSAVAVFSKPVALFLAVTLAPGTTAPLGSRTRPSMSPVVACDCASDQTAARQSDGHNATTRATKGGTLVDMVSSLGEFGKRARGARTGSLTAEILRRAAAAVKELRIKAIIYLANCD